MAQEVANRRPLARSRQHSAQSLNWACNMDTGAKVAPLSMVSKSGEKPENGQSVIIDLQNSGAGNEVSASTGKSGTLLPRSASMLPSKAAPAATMLVAAPAIAEASAGGGFGVQMGVCYSVKMVADKCTYVDWHIL